MATHSSTLAWKIPWTEEPGRLQSMGSLSWTWLSDWNELKEYRQKSLSFHPFWEFQTPISSLGTLDFLSICLGIDPLNGLLSLHMKREDNTLKWWFFFFIWNQSMWHTLIKLFHLSNLLQMLNNHTMTLSSLTNPYVVVTESNLMILSVVHCQLLMAGHYAPHLQLSLLLCKTSWTNTTLYIH